MNKEPGGRTTEGRIKPHLAIQEKEQQVRSMTRDLPVSKTEERNHWAVCIDEVYRIS